MVCPNNGRFCAGCAFCVVTLPVYGAPPAPPPAPPAAAPAAPAAPPTPAVVLYLRGALPGWEVRALDRDLVAATHEDGFRASWQLRFNGGSPRWFAEYSRATGTAHPELAAPEIQSFADPAKPRLL